MPAALRAAHLLVCAAWLPASTNAAAGACHYLRGGGGGGMGAQLAGCLLLLLLLGRLLAGFRETAEPQHGSSLGPDCNLPRPCLCPTPEP